MATSADPKFPDWFPPRRPPDSASDATGIVFRFIQSSFIDPADFLSHHELGLAPRAQPCRRCSLSVYRTLDFAREKLSELRARFPGRFGSHIAQGRLLPEHGKLKQKGIDLDHHEWWAYDGVERHEPFQMIELLH